MYNDELKLIAQAILSLSCGPQVRYFCKYNNETVKLLITATSFLSRSSKTKQRAYCIINNITSTPTCKMCCNNVNWYTGGRFLIYCSLSCKGKDPVIKQRVKHTCLKNNGVENPLQSKRIQEKQKQTMFKRYGVRNPSQLQLVKNKKIHTCLKNYGVNHSLQSEKILNKAKQTNIQRYGVENSNQKHMIDILPLLQDYNWLYDQYATQQKSASQIGCELNIFYGTVLVYLRKHNIKIRDVNTFSHKQILWLESIMKEQNIFIQHAQNIGEYKISGTRYVVDGYCQQTNTVYEFYGDFFHGNPNIFKSDFYNNIMYKTAGELYQKTLEREDIIRSLGFNIVTIWESTK
ncbi:MAG: DUF7487 domain-containing protein [Nitrosopumilaceae archaeon]